MDARGLPSGHRISTDVCIVGGGPAGIVLAGQLADGGIDVALLESGGDDIEAEAQSLASGESVGEPYFPLDRARYRAYGGTSHHWISARAHPLDSFDFESRSGIPHSGWPIPRESLDSYYPVAQRLLALGPPRFDAAYWGAQIGARPLPLDERVVTSTMFQFGPVDSVLRLRAALDASPNVTVYRHATVLALQPDEDGHRVGSVLVASTPDRRFSVDARAVVLAGGGIENARLLMLSGIGTEHDVVGRYFMEHPHVRAGTIRPADGRLLGLLGLYRKIPTDGIRVSAALVPAAERLRREEILNSAWFLHARSSVFASAAARAISGLVETQGFAPPAPHRGARLRTLAAHPVSAVGTAGSLLARRATGRSVPRAQLVELRLMAEQAPNPSSRVTLGERRDRFGQPVARLDWRLTDLDYYSIRRGQEVLDEALQAAGLGQVEERFGEQRPPIPISGGYHHMGTTRMSDSPRSGVVDRDCRVHGVGNLFIAGSSVFPTVGYANPTLTITALTLRLAAHLRPRVRSMAAPAHRPA
jgi:choline dehydrogenase-like flavoprotein